jgi:hypothetical protein
MAIADDFHGGHDAPFGSWKAHPGRTFRTSGARRQRCQRWPLSKPNMAWISLSLFNISFILGGAFTLDFGPSMKTKGVTEVMSLRLCEGMQYRLPSRHHRGGCIAIALGTLFGSIAAINRGKPDRSRHHGPFDGIDCLSFIHHCDLPAPISSAGC